MDGRMTVHVSRVWLPDGSTIGHGYGHDEDGRKVTFAGDRRMLQDLSDALDESHPDATLPAEVRGHQLTTYIGVPGPWHWEDQ